MNGKEHFESLLNDFNATDIKYTNESKIEDGIQYVANIKNIDSEYDETFSNLINTGFELNEFNEYIKYEDFGYITLSNENKMITIEVVDYQGDLLENDNLKSECETVFQEILKNFIATDIKYCNEEKMPDNSIEYVASIINVENYEDFINDIKNNEEYEYDEGSNCYVTYTPFGFISFEFTDRIVIYIRNENDMEEYNESLTPIQEYYDEDEFDDNELASIYGGDTAQSQKDIAKDELLSTKNFLDIYLNSSINANGFMVEIRDTENKVIYKEKYSYGYNASYDKDFANNEKPFVTDIIKNICKQYDIPKENIAVSAGKNKFNGKNVNDSKVNEFKTNYLKDLMLEAVDDWKEPIKTNKENTKDKSKECLENDSNEENNEMIVIEYVTGENDKEDINMKKTSNKSLKESKYMNNIYDCLDNIGEAVSEYSEEYDDEKLTYLHQIIDLIEDNLKSIKDFMKFPLE